MWPTSGGPGTNKVADNIRSAGGGAVTMLANMARKASGVGAKATGEARRAVKSARRKGGGYA